MRRRHAVIGAVAVAAALTLTSCGSGGDDAAGSGDVTIEWWVPNWDEEESRDLIAQFEEEHPGVTIKTVVTQWETMANQIRVALDSGDVPDVITELTSRIPNYARQDQLADVTDWYDDAMPRDDFYEAAVETASFDGVVYGVPMRWDAGSMIYNVDLFEQAGLEAPPATWDELIEAAQAMQELGVYGYGWPYGDPGNSRVRWLNAYYTHGGTFTEEADGSVTIDPAASLAAIEMITEGFEEGWVTPSSLEATNTDLQNLFMNGQLGFYFDGAYAVTPIKEAGVNVGTAMWPGPDGPGTVSADGFSYIVPAGAENLDVVKEFVQFLALPEHQALMTDTFPARYSAAEDERFSDELLQPFLEQHGEHSSNRPAYPGWEELIPTIHSALQSVALGDQTAEEANEAILEHAGQILRTS